MGALWGSTLIRFVLALGASTKKYESKASFSEAGITTSWNTKEAGDEAGDGDEREDGEQILDEQQAHHELADVAVMQHRGRQQLDTEDGAREHRGDPGHRGLGLREPERLHDRAGRRDA